MFLGLRDDKNPRNAGCHTDRRFNYGVRCLALSEVKRMLHYALVFLVIAIVAAIFGLVESPLPRPE